MTLVTIDANLLSLQTSRNMRPQSTMISLNYGKENTLNSVSDLKKKHVIVNRTLCKS